MFESLKIRFESECACVSEQKKETHGGKAGIELKQ